MKKKVRSGSSPRRVWKHRDGTTAHIQLISNLESPAGNALDLKRGELGNDRTPLTDSGGGDAERPRDIRGLLKVIKNFAFEHAPPFTTLKCDMQAHANVAGLTLLNMENLPDLASRLRVSIKDAGISNVDLATECGVTPAAITRWLSGEIKKLKADNYAAAARALGVREEWLRTGKLPRERDAQDLQVERAMAAFRRMREPLEELLQVVRDMDSQEKKGRRGA